MCPFFPQRKERVKDWLVGPDAGSSCSTRQRPSVSFCTPSWCTRCAIPCNASISTRHPVVIPHNTVTHSFSRSLSFSLKFAKKLPMQVPPFTASLQKKTRASPPAASLFTLRTNSLRDSSRCDSVLARMCLEALFLRVLWSRTMYRADFLFQLGGKGGGFLVQTRVHRKMLLVQSQKNKSFKMLF